MDGGMHAPLVLSGIVSKFEVPKSTDVITMLLTASPYKHLDLMCTCHYERGNVALPREAMVSK